MLVRLKFKEMNETSFIQKFTKDLEIEPNRFSCLKIAINDARKLTGRNILSGDNELNILISTHDIFNPNSFIALINYLLILDLIGEVFGLKGFTTKKNNNIYKALKQFAPTISEKDIETIIALRNSLAHNYGLVNIPKSETENSTKRHKFILLHFESSFLIKYPTTIWNGDFKEKSEDKSTQISTTKLIELIEQSYKNLVKASEDNEIELKLSGGIEELKSRFTIMY